MSNNLLIRPLITEKGTNLIAENKYLFEVDKKATKPEIKKEVEKRFKVKVLAVNTLNQKGKIRRRGRFEGKTSAFKKAIVTLRRGDKIEIFEGA